MHGLTSEQQRSFFETFGFLKLPGMVVDDLLEITREFEQVFAQLGVHHDGTRRTSVVPFIDKRPGLCVLLDRDDIAAAVSNLIGPDFNYMGSDGNYYAGDTTWHRDGFMPSDSFIKVAFYLDRVTHDSGCLRVMPGSHTDAALELWHDPVLRDSERVWNLHQRDLPSYSIESEPGDALIFSHRLLHASFGGGSARRMFTMNLGRHAESEQEIDDLIEYGNIHFIRNGFMEPYGHPMIATASHERMVHLSQFQLYWQASLDRHAAQNGVVQTDY
ncbi:MAG TPA: phytanoyl-CoA dioxygenase family protein [Rhodothermia bacterium]|nr:phytanoyl-CoA dioxygenase family protein [Rhodothermia bacterium]